MSMEAPTQGFVAYDREMAPFFDGTALPSGARFTTAEIRESNALKTDAERISYSPARSWTTSGTRVGRRKSSITPRMSLRRRTDRSCWRKPRASMPRAAPRCSSRLRSTKR